MSALRRIYERARRILLAVRSEFERGDGDGIDLNADYYGPNLSETDAPGTARTPTASEPIDVGCAIEKKSPDSGRRPVERSTGAVASRRGRARDFLGRRDGPELDPSRRYIVEVKATGKGAWLVAKGRRNDYSHLSLSAIQAAKNELWAKGSMPDGMILREDEVRFLMETYLGAKPGDPIPKKLEIMGLPVKVSD